MGKGESIIVEQGIRKPFLRRLAHRGGVKHISNVCYEDVCGILKEFLEDVVGVCNNSKLDINNNDFYIL